MCTSKPSAPAPPPPPPAPPKQPRKTDPNVRQAKTNARNMAARAGGRRSTLLGGQLDLQPENQAGKTLLGS